jgi:predicted nucleic acid-binding protein
MMSKLILDSSAWIEYFMGSDKGKKVRAHLAKANAFTIITGVTVAEICKKFLQTSQPSETLITALRMMTKLVTIDYKAGEDTARIVIKQRQTRPKFSTADAHIVAIARQHNVRIITCDTDFLDIPEATVIK